MIVAHLIGGNEVKGIREGIVIVNGKQLEATYQEIVAVCGNISLGDLDTSITTRRGSEAIQRDYIELVEDYTDGELGAEFVIDNHLTEEIVYSEYEVDFENQTLTLKIDTYA